MSRIKMKWQWKQEDIETVIRDCGWITDRDANLMFWPSNSYYDSEEAAYAYLERLLDAGVSDVNFQGYVLVKVFHSVEK